jgi:hypothetical protein
MRRIFTFSFIAIALSLASFSSFAQTCDVSTTNPNPTPAFGSALAVNSGNGFTSSNQSTLGTYDNGQTDELTSPIYSYPTGSQTTVYFKYHLASTHAVQSSTPTSYGITLLYGNPVQTVSCTGTWSLGAITTSGADYYFSISGISWPINRHFQIRLTLTNGSRDVAATAFQTNAQLSPAGTVLPVKFQTFDATPSSNSVSLKWMVATEENLSGYAVEKSFDGRNFSKVGFVNAANQSTYTFTDAKSSGTVYYRIKSIDVDGKYAFSTIALVKAGKSLIVLNAFPSPFVNSFNLDHGTATAGSLITISTEDGRTIKTIIPTVGSQRTPVDLSTAKAGLYLVRYKNSIGEVETLKILKQQ